MYVGIKEAGLLLKKGEIVAFPTETVYGLGAPIFDERAVAKIYAAKGRPSDNPLIAHLSHIDQVARIARDVPEEFYHLADHFFPGPLTVVLHKHTSVPKIVSGGLDTIALRFPAHPLAQELIELVGEPLVAPSANLSGKPSSTSALHVAHDFGNKIGGIIDGGECSLGIESTVLSLVSGPEPLLLRPGSVSREELERVLKRPVRQCTSSSKEAHASPGMRYRHYAPKAPLYCFEVLRAFEERIDPTKKQLILGRHPKAHSLLTNTNLYALLRQADAEGYAEILVYCDSSVSENVALMNRLTHAQASDTQKTVGTGLPSTAG